MTDRSGPAGGADPVDQRRILINSIAAVLGHGANLVLLVWLHQYLLTRVEVEEYAVYLLVVTPLFLVPLVLGALSSTVSRYVVVRLNEGSEAGARQVVATTLLMSVSLALLLALPAAAVRAWIGPLLGISERFVGEAQAMFTMLGAVTLVRIAASPLVIGPFVRERFVVTSVLNLATQLVRIGLIVGLLLQLEVRVYWVVVGTAIAEALGLVATVVVSMGMLPALRVRPGDIDWSSAPALASFGGWSFGRSLAVATRRTAEPLLLNRLAGALDVTCFHLGSLVLTQLQGLMGQAMSPFEPPLTALYARGETGRLRAIYLRINRLAFLASLLVVIPVIVHQRELVELYVGDRFLDAGVTMSVLVLLLPIRWCNIVVGPLANARNRVRDLSIAGLMVNGASLGLMTVALLLGLGSIGAAVACVVGVLAVCSRFMWPLGWDLAGTTGPEWARTCLRPGLLPALLGAVAWILLRAWIVPGSWGELFGSFLGGAAVYLVAVWLVAVTEEDRRDAMRVARRVLGRPGA